MFDYSILAIRGLSFVPCPSRILIIGLGGGVVPREARQIYPDSILDIIEIDEKIIDVAKEYFFFKEDDKMKVHKGDAFIITQEMKEPYDFIMVDAFLTNYIPFPLMSLDFIKIISELVTDNSIISVNCCNIHPSFNSHVKTYYSLFGVNIYRVDGHRNPYCTSLYVCKGKTLIPSKINITEEIEKEKIMTLSVNETV